MESDLSQSESDFEECPYHTKQEKGSITMKIHKTNYLLSLPETRAKPLVIRSISKRDNAQQTIGSQFETNDAATSTPQVYQQDFSTYVNLNEYKESEDDAIPQQPLTQSLPMFGEMLKMLSAEIFKKELRILLNDPILPTDSKRSLKSLVTGCQKIFCAVFNHTQVLKRN